MKKNIALAACAALYAAMPAQAQKMDTDAMMRWASAKVVGYQIVGVYEGRVNVVGGSKWIGYADVTGLDLDVYAQHPEIGRVP